MGPKGLHSVMSTLNAVYEAFTANYPNVRHDVYDEFFTQVDSLCQSSHQLVGFLRFRVPCSLWYPVGGFREFAVEYEALEGLLPVGLVLWYLINC